MNFSLTPELEHFIEKEVSSGLYRSASEVVRAGLRLLKEREALRLPELPATRQELEAQLLAASQSLDAGEGIDIETSRRHFQSRLLKPRANA